MLISFFFLSVWGSPVRKTSGRLSRDCLVKKTKAFLWSIRIFDHSNFHAFNNRRWDNKPIIPKKTQLCIATDEKRAKIWLWLNMRSVCCVFLGIILRISWNFSKSAQKCCLFFFAKMIDNRFRVDHPRKSAQPEGSFPKDIQQTTQ